MFILIIKAEFISPQYFVSIIRKYRNSRLSDWDYDFFVNVFLICVCFVIYFLGYGIYIGANSHHKELRLHRIFDKASFAVHRTILIIMSSELRKYAWTNIFLLCYFIRYCNVGRNSIIKSEKRKILLAWSLLQVYSYRVRLRAISIRRKESEHNLDQW